ncbi:MAG: hypothetical protein ACK4IU_18360 [Tabrizicola flagellatus]|uniref:hypothetical protein n=1 Tax=Tabrizicola flagellatus TaxID=2593021 RepID=UPI00391CA8AB
MVAYSFQPRFIEPIRQGFKTQTIRAIGQRRHARPGELLQLYSGMRTRHCERILPDTPCLEVMQVEIQFRAGEIARIVTDGAPIRDLDAFALRDGFADAVDMSAFWRDHHPQVTSAGFNGVLIEWARPAETMQVAA